MSRITLDDGLSCELLVMPGYIVDKYLLSANESQLKIYLYLLRMRGRDDVSISSIADYFNYSESDVKRAIRFWNKCGVIAESAVEDKEKKETKETKPVRETEAEKGGNVVAFSSRPSYTAKQITEFGKRPEIKQLMFIIEQYFVQYMDRHVKSDDIDTIMYISEELKFDEELIEYLVEYCVGSASKNGKSGLVSARQIEQTANEWHDAGVTNVKDARQRTMTVPPEIYKVFEAFGLAADRRPEETEVRYFRKWTESYGFGLDVISEACRRTIQAICKPSFKYANSIIKKWYDNDVRKYSDIEVFDKKFYAQKANEAVPEKKIQTVAKKSEKTSKGEPSPTKFTNFKQRVYDYDKLEKDILSN